ncbi:hypothetical protein ACHWQZ_G003536 [Mnemiopsis leidyi]
MTEYTCTPIQDKPALKYVDRLHEIKRAICTLDESLTPSKRVGHKSIGLSPMFGTPQQHRKNFDSIALLDHQNVLTPSRTSATALENNGLDSSQISDSFLHNPEVAATVEKITSSNLLIKSFSEVYKEISTEDVLSVVSSFAEQCEELYQNSKSMLLSVKHSKLLSQKLRDACSNIANERYTWKLLGAIYQNKLNTTMSENDDSDSHLGAINRLYTKSGEIRHNQVVLDWLESNASELLPDLPTKVGYFSGKVSWENTFHTLCNQKVKKIISTMDPDAPSREGAPLHEIDAEDQSRLVKHMFHLVRAGQVDKAQQLCIESGQCWRAAVIEGWRLYHDPNAHDLSRDRDSVEGNITRALWKNCCWDFCNSSGVSTEEKALYGALSGNLQAILPACTNFHDVLWAHFKTLLDQEVEEELCDSMLPHSYWKDLLSLESVIDTMGKMKQSRDLYNKLQLQLICGNLSGILQTVSEHIEKAGLSQCRFLCHLLLILETIYPDQAPAALHDTLTKYILALQNEECMEEVVFYASLLPSELQISLLSEVLAHVEDLSRPQCVQYAAVYSVPIEEVSMRIYKKIVSESCSSPDPGMTSVANISDGDARVVGAISWLLLSETQRRSALREANRLIRMFLGARKHAPACAVFEMIPSDTIEVIHREWSKENQGIPLPPDDINAVREYLCLQAYLDTHQAYSDWSAHRANRPSNPTCNLEATTTFSEKVAFEEKKKSFEISIQRWEQNLTVQTQLTRDKMLNVLLFIDGGWLVDEIKGTDCLREEQLKSLRRQYIPSTTSLLVDVLRQSEQDQAVVELCDYIASEQYQLYNLFNQNELRELLEKVYDSSIKCGCNPLQFGTED